MRPMLLLAVLSIWASSIFAASPKAARHRPMSFLATAYAAKGRTATGTISKFGTVAADPAILPMGTRIHIVVRGYQGLDGTYIVSDTGAAVKGRHIDIRLPSAAQARRFGKRRVTVRILEIGRGKGDPKLEAAKI
jgi:3D (Asp-Asp-Asp) domain-containing protein